MRKSVFVMALLALACSCAWAQAGSEKKSIKDVMDANVKIVEGEFMPAVEAMPEDKFGFAPTGGEFKGVRTFGQQVKHVAAVNYLVGSTILSEKPPIELGGENGPDTVKTKDDIIKFAKDSFAYAHKAIASISDENALGEINNPFGKGKTTRLSMASVLAWHAMDHYGQMVVYLRMNAIVPPASRQ